MAHVTNFSLDTSAEFRTNYYSSPNPKTSDSPIRVVLFKECRFKERQLLFDSVTLQNGESKSLKKNDFSTISNGSLQRYSKASDEFCNLTEMIFGSTAMRYHGTYFKVHNISSPERIVFTQVFATPYKTKHKIVPTGNSANKISRSSFDFPDWNSNNDSSNSFCNISSASSISIFRRNSSTTTNSSSVTVDSGFSERSFTSSSTCTSLSSHFSSFERSNYSEEDISMPLEAKERLDMSLTLQDSFLSKTSYSVKPNYGYSRLGLAVIITTTTEKNIYQHYFMDHISFIESILWRIRQYVAYASSMPKYFLSLMSEITSESTRWLFELLKNLKIIENDWSKENETANDTRLILPTNLTQSSVFKNFGTICAEKWKLFKRRQTLHQKQHVIDNMCQLLQQVETKETNFFLSSLLTAVLTHHLGWVATCFTTINKETVTLKHSFNALWCQLKEIIEVTGQSKTSKIIVHHTLNNNLVRDTLAFLRYFIRCSQVQKREIERQNVEEENEIVNQILNNGDCSTPVTEKSFKFENGISFTKQKSKLSKTKTLSSNLVDLACIEEDLDVVLEEEEPVIFILGDNEELVNLKDSSNKEVANINIDNHQEYVKTDTRDDNSRTKVISFPLPKFCVTKEFCETLPYECSLKNDPVENFIPDLILQGTTAPLHKWKTKLKNDLISCNNCFLADGSFEESVAIVGDMDNWKVLVLSSDKNLFHKASYEQMDGSELVGNMLEVLQQMWTLGIPKQYCTTHIEQRLLEICLRSNALAQVLLSTDFCTMDILLSTLGVTVSDIPVLMSVVSTVYPEVARKYGLSYQ